MNRKDTVLACIVYIRRWIWETEQRRSRCNSVAKGSTHQRQLARYSILTTPPLEHKQDTITEARSMSVCKAPWTSLLAEDSLMIHAAISLHPFKLAPAAKTWETLH